MRQCRISSCCKLAHHPCCADCKDRTCTARCLNSPERCGCWWDTALRPSKIDRDKVLRLHNQGLLQKEIARRLRCSTSSVSAILWEMGVRSRG